jgi:hypothetical protein
MQMQAAPTCRVPSDGCDGLACDDGQAASDDVLDKDEVDQGQPEQDLAGTCIATVTPSCDMRTFLQGCANHAPPGNYRCCGT